MTYLSGINLNHLHSFWRIAGTGSISAAARALYRSQPALSLQMEQLELALGRKLFERERRGMSLTTDGKLLFECCEQVFPVIGQCLSSMAEGETEGRVFKIAASWTISYERIDALMKFIRRQSPGTSVSVTSGGPDYLTMRLAGGLADLAVSNADIGTKLGKGYCSKLMSRTQLYFVASPELKASIGSFPEGLSGKPMIMRPAENPVRRSVDMFFHRNGLTPMVHSELSNHEIIKRMVADGEGVAVIDPLSAAQELASGRLVKLHSRPAGIYEDVWFACARHPDSASAKTVLYGLMSEFAFRMVR